MRRSKVIFTYDADKGVRDTRIGNFTLGKTYDVAISPDRLNFQIRNDIDEVKTLSHVLIDCGIFIEVYKIRDEKLKSILDE